VDLTVILPEEHLWYIFRNLPAIETAVVAIGLPLIETDAPVSVTMFSPPS
jgi:hypothetical protein